MLAPGDGDKEEDDVDYDDDEDGDFLLHPLLRFAKSFKILIMNIKVCWPQRKVLTFPARVAARAADPEGSTTSPLL